MANIRTSWDEHERVCTRRPSTSRSFCCEAHATGIAGDVRRCDHGYVMLAYDVRGATAPKWRTLSPIWTPILFWRARKALSS